MRFMIIVRAAKNTEAGVMPRGARGRADGQERETLVGAGRLGTKVSAGRRAFSWRAIRQTKLQLPTTY
jgi:hypothetical protein